MSAPPSAPAAIVDVWKEAALKIEQDRGEPMGRQAAVTVPAQLKHYEDRRRFLGAQLAESLKQQLTTPADFAEMVTLINKGEFVELSPLGKGYILYGVGMLASDEPFTHYDKATRKSVPLFPNTVAMQSELDRITTTQKQQNEELTELRKQLRQVKKRDREQRETLESEIKEKEKSAIELAVKRKAIVDFYGSAKSSDMLFAEYETIAARARDFGGRSYDLNDATARKELKMRLLCYLRPMALKVLEELGQAYEAKFLRPLPVSSLVRPDEYQRQLRERNRNATTIDVPPHTTGLAFDVFYRFMSGAEQDFVMAELARMRDAGRIEALRENNNHFHVFAYEEGHPPEEELVKQSMDHLRPPEAEKKITKSAASKRKRVAKRRRR